MIIQGFPVFIMNMQLFSITHVPAIAMPQITKMYRFYFQ